MHLGPVDFPVRRASLQRCTYEEILFMTRRNMIGLRDFMIKLSRFELSRLVIKYSFAMRLMILPLHQE
jgi:hypothetical protein